MACGRPRAGPPAPTAPVASTPRRPTASHLRAAMLGLGVLGGLGSLVLSAPPGSPFGGTFGWLLLGVLGAMLAGAILPAGWLGGRQLLQSRVTTLRATEALRVRRVAERERVLHGNPGLELEVEVVVEGPVPAAPLELRVQLKDLDWNPLHGLLPRYRDGAGRFLVRDRGPPLEPGPRDRRRMGVWFPSCAVGTAEGNPVAVARAVLEFLAGGKELGLYSVEVQPPFDRLQMHGAVPAEATRAVADGAGATCQVCGDLVQDQGVACTACETPHHQDCWEYLEGCSTYGCPGNPVSLGLPGG